MVPSFVEDLIDYITNGVISIHSIEEHAGHFRDPTKDLSYPGGPIQDYIVAKNKDKYGQSIGYYHIFNDTAKRKRIFQKEHLAMITLF